MVAPQPLLPRIKSSSSNLFTVTVLEVEEEVAGQEEFVPPSEDPILFEEVDDDE